MESLTIQATISHHLPPSPTIYLHVYGIISHTFRSFTPKCWQLKLLFAQIELGTRLPGMLLDYRRFHMPEVRH